MSKFIINEKLYDTEKMELVGEVKKWYYNGFLSAVWGGEKGYTYNCNLYKSAKGNWLLTHTEGSTIFAEAIAEDEAKRLVKQLKYEIYVKHFGELEEA